MSLIDEDSVPSTIKAAVDDVVSRVTEEDREAMKDMDEGTFGARVHHSIGRYIRNNWSLWAKDSPLKRDAVNTYGIAHGDDISGLILAWIWHAVVEKEFDPQEHVKKYHEHWKATGSDALKAGGWPPKDDES